MRIDSIKNGIVIDHIAAGKAKEVYDALDLGKLDCQVAIIMNCRSNKMGKKDIIKIDNDFDVDLDVLGYIDPNITVSIIKNGETVEKKKLQLPEKIINVAKCKNPRCITSVERDLDQVFYLANREKRIYRCIIVNLRLRRRTKSFFFYNLIFNSILLTLD